MGPSMADGAGAWAGASVVAPMTVIARPRARTRRNGRMSSSSQDLLQEAFRALLVRAREERLGLARFHDHALVHEDDAVGHFAGETHLVGHDDHGHALAREVQHDA